ncbi:MAG TPA: hypothetical protein PK821_06635 [Victivallales bacterium]|nr:hypothetical protein [Victivallales bacterium]
MRLVSRMNFFSRYWRKISILAIFLLNIFYWVLPSNISKLISKDRPILLGRYSVERVTLLFFLVPISLMLIYLLTSDNKNFKKRLFAVVLVLISILITLPVADTAARILRKPRYVQTQKTYHRPPNQQIKVTYEDTPESSIPGPKIKNGYPDQACTLTVDSRGFRNKSSLDSCDIVTLGDSFVEGSRVSDDDIWAALIANDSGLSVYNLGMSGSSPIQYLNNFIEVGIPMKPKYLICMFYEGNDFREPSKKELKYLQDNKNWDNSLPAAEEKKDNAPDHRSETRAISRIIRDYVKQSPFIVNGKRLLIEKLGNTAASQSQTEQTNVKGLSWIPFTFPRTKNYSFKPKRFLSFFVEKSDFETSNPWKSVSMTMLRMKDACDRNGIKMIVVYAPTAANVLLPFIAEKVPAAEFRDFLLLDRSDIPPEESLYSELISKSAVIENTISEFCSEKGIEFISLKAKLREKTVEDIQCYYTYDQHWTPDGHKVAADAIMQKINESSYSHKK